MLLLFPGLLVAVELSLCLRPENICFPDAPPRMEKPGISLHNAPMSAPTKLLSPLWIGWREGRLHARWSAPSWQRLRLAAEELQATLADSILPSCTHFRGHGGVKGTVRTLTGIAPEYRFVARFDVARYYDSMDHSVLLALLAREDPSERLFAIVSEYLARPDMRRTGRGMVAGGSLSPLLGALYLKPLDDAIERLVASGKIFYVRYMDDFVLLARTRWHLREAIATVYRVMKELKLCLHREKRFVGKIGGGFSFLGYRVHPGRKLRPSTEGVRRMTTRFRRLYEQGATGTRLWEYVSRWTRWLWGGLDGLVSRKGGIRRYYFGVIKRLRIVGLYRPVESVGPAHPLL